MTFTLQNKRVWVAGHRGMVGSAIVRRLANEDCEILTAGRDELDLKDQAATRAWLQDRRPDAVIVAAAKVGGILANSSFPADFLYDNLVIETNVIEGSVRAGVSKLLFLGSSCIFPKFAPQPIEEEALLTGPLEPTNEWYAIAKIAGIKLCQAYRKQHGVDFISGMPTNLYGPHDNFDLESSHVLPALIRKFDDARRLGADSVTLWGTGTPRREFLHVDDCADACLFLLKSYSGDQFVNIGFGSDVAISELASLIGGVTGFAGTIAYDVSRPDGTPRKLMSSARLNAMGWQPRIGLREGIEQTYKWYLENIAGIAA
ncbi:GDP-L-fucose synthase [Sphingobium mellinum]|uniref:GDP-L-fucose synthase n=1 Tax=Sphingobium mellinum TaxID=1387166 RepID=UPI0030ED01B3